MIRPESNIHRIAHTNNSGNRSRHCWRGSHGLVGSDSYFRLLVIGRDLCRQCMEPPSLTGGQAMSSCDYLKNGISESTEKYEAGKGFENGA